MRGAALAGPLACIAARQAPPDVPARQRLVANGGRSAVSRRRQARQQPGRRLSCSAAPGPSIEADSHAAFIDTSSSGDEQQEQQGSRGEGAALPSGLGHVVDVVDEEADLPPGRYSYKMVKAQPERLIAMELRRRRINNLGRKDQLASRLYGALFAEGRALSSEESAAVDAALGLDSAVIGFQGQIDPDSGGSASEDEAAALAAGELASSAELAANPLLSLQSSVAGRFLTEANQERLMSNAGNLQLFFMWAATAPNGIKLCTSCLVRTAKSVWLIECGEDSQRHLPKNQSVGWAKLDRIFISSLSGDKIAGLPGMLCTISAARERGLEVADTPLHLYGPVGLADYINTMLGASHTYLEMPVIVHEFVTHPVPEDELDELVEVNARSRLYATRLPPDQLNPQGYYDGELRPLLSRHKRKRSNAGIDLRAGSRPMALPPPGDPRRAGQLTVADLTWTLRMDHEWLVRVGALRASRPTFGFLLVEAERQGRLYADRAVELGAQVGADLSELKQGRPVQTPDGRTVYPWQCVGPVKRSRRIAFIGSCLDSSNFARVMSEPTNWPQPESSEQTEQDCPYRSWSRAPDADAPVVDVVVHSMSPPNAASSGMTSTAMATAAGASAATLRARELVLWQQHAEFSESAEGRDNGFPAEMLGAAKEALGCEHVSLAGCHWCFQPDRQPDPPQWSDMVLE